jgi:hypothetical protein
VGRQRAETPRASRPGKLAAHRLFRLPGFVWVFLAGWITRLLFLLRQEDHGQPFSALFQGDAAAFLAYARGLILGQPYDQGIPFHPPAYPHVLEILLKLFGYRPGAVPPGLPAGDLAAAIPAEALKICMAALGGLTCALFYALARRVAGRPVALAALPLALFSFGHYVQSAAIDSEALFLPLALGVTLGVLSLAESQAAGQALFGQPRAGWRAFGLAVTPGPLRFALAGALGVLGAWAALTRAEFLLTALLLAAVWVRIVGRRAWPAVAVFVAAIALAMAPWTAHCYRSIGAVNTANAEHLPHPLPRFVLVTGYGPLNFATANNSYATGAFDTGLVERLVPQREGRGLDLADPEINRLYVDGYRVGLAWMTAHPAAALRLIGRKLEFASHALSLGYLQADMPAGLRGERRPVDQFVPAARGLLWVHLALMALGLARLLHGHPFGRAGREEHPRHAGGPAGRGGAIGSATGGAAAHGWPVDRGASPLRAAWVFLLPHVATTLAVIAAFFGYVRLGFLLAPVVWILAGAGLLAMLEAIPWPADWRRHPAGVAAALIAALLLIEAAGVAAGPQRYHLTGSRIPGTDQLNPDDVVFLQPGR